MVYDPNSCKSSLVNVTTIAFYLVLRLDGLKGFSKVMNKIKLRIYTKYIIADVPFLLYKQNAL